MELTTEERNELNDLSLKYYGSASKWQKICKNGRAEPTKKMDGSVNEKYSIIKRPTPQEILSELRAIGQFNIQKEKQKIAEKIKNDTIIRVAQAAGVLNVEEFSKRTI
jgi:hypothetical protein